MKKILLLSAFFVFGITAANAQEIASTTKVKTEVKKAKKAKKTKKGALPAVEGPGMVFENETIDYGTIDQNADGQREFAFTNNGNKPLIIMSATGSCGCTVPDAPKEPIAPGAKAVIKVKYDTNRVGPFTKTVTVTSNASATPKTLTIKGDVKAPAAKTQEVKS
ncbi:hypothetical protein FCR2A7T_15100 [Flavobacterium cauense R2A-7]|uniref:Uncharacterized protein DUF1573 n=1 Tax=Flavobacterium cauense R2A-7 TaxID=1341154 RepID=V6S6T6_9FLAO|nr:DUF1573 domain-containing protein [Flavobacterium cauense]ESU20100.1 hypothetical protein FCR2A7T_15100 [Flavobacterium cauense R2A-7]KGO83902.1 hypothetical protein Q762_01255 [Flavobacterium cauense R2A-7]TWI14761.1 uncharacterized protein DUF1573 [Flavobacterium cauense R2A-7]